MQAKQNCLKRYLSTHTRPFRGALVVLWLGTGTGLADPPGPAQIRIQQAIIEPSVSSGVEVTLVAADPGGTGPFTYVWRLNGKEVVGAILVGPQLRLGGVEPDDAGEYTVLVRNAEGEALSPPFALEVDPTFTNIPVATGGLLYAAEWVDMNHDGWLDLSAGVATSSSPCWRVFLNSREGGFVPVWEETFGDVLDFYDRGYGDYDNDGFPDAAVGTDGSAPFCVYHNVGGRRLERVWQGSGPYFRGGWADLDNDGYLDLVQLHPWGIAQVYLNDHDGPPFHVVRTAGEPGWALTKVRESHYTAWGDYDADGLLDLYVTGYTVPGQLFRNVGGGNFVATDFQGPANASLDAAWVDYDGDGDLDLVITYYFDFLDVYRNEGDGRLVQMTAAEIGDLATDRTDHSPTMSWGDYDNDGDLDLYRTDGVGPGRIDYTPAPGRLYSNQGDGRFVRVMAGSPTTARFGYLYTASWADYDNDGFLDLLGSMASQNGSPLYRNNLPRTGNANRWLKVRCEGRVSNRDAVGTKLRIKATIAGKERCLVRQIVRAASGGPLLAHFGLGDATQADVLQVEWPSGAVQAFANVKVNQSLVIKEPPRLVPTGPCEFEVKCWEGMHFTVEASLDLKTWIPVGTVLNVDGMAKFSDAVGAQGRCRFYRVVEP